MFNIVKWWTELKWNDESYDKVKEGTMFTRAKPLMWKQLFLRDRLTVIFNVVLGGIVVFIIISGLRQL